jgi:3-oxoacyl-[acyl-carrier protein] reductase
MNLTGKVAIVTGGGRDIGKMTSIKLASLGAKVVINYFGAKEEAEKTEAEIKAAGGEAILVQGDMTKQADVDHLVQKEKSNWKNIIHQMTLVMKMMTILCWMKKISLKGLVS